MLESFFSKAKADGQVFMKTMTLATKLSKLKIEINKKQRERDRVIKAIGTRIVELYEQTRVIDAAAIFDAVSADLASVDQLEQATAQLEQEIEQVKADFRATSGRQPPPENPA